MRIASFGIIADLAGSGAGAFSLLLSTLLDEGDEVDFYGVPSYTRPRSLERYARYHYFPLRVQAIQRMWPAVLALGSKYPHAALSQLAHVAYQREAILRIEENHRSTPYDFVLCLDGQNFWPSHLPLLSWPQSPPNSEWAALRRQPMKRALEESAGKAHARAVELFYAYRWIQARVTLGASDLMLCGSHWARDEWLRFGLDSKRAATIAYPIAASQFAGIEAPGRRSDRCTFLWLGRATPRKRLDLFLDAFHLVRRTHSDASALLVGNLTDRAATALLDRHRDEPGVVVVPPVPRERVESVFADADVLVQPSEHENFGFAVAEALAAGRPVVVGPTNGTGDYAGRASFRFDAYDAPSVARAMELAREAVRSDGDGIARLARQAAAEHFDPVRVSSRLRELARRAMQLSASGPC